MSNHRKIFIKNLIVDVFIGVHDFEKKNKQRVVINVEVDVEACGAVPIILPVCKDAIQDSTLVP